MTTTPSIFIIEHQHFENNNNGADWEEWRFVSEDHDKVFYQTREEAQAVVDNVARWRHERGFELTRDRIVRENGQRELANKEKAAIEAAGLVYRQVHGWGASYPGELTPVPTLEEWMANMPEPEMPEMRVVELTLATS